MRPPSIINLGPGEIVHMHAHRGMQFVAVRGAFEIVGPAAWLAERVVTPRISLRDGEAHIMASGGTIALESRARTEIRCIPAQPRLQAMRWMTSLAAAVRRRLVPAACRHA